MHAIISIAYLDKINVHINIAINKVSRYETVLHFVNKRTNGRTTRNVVVIMHQLFLPLDETI